MVVSKSASRIINEIMLKVIYSVGLLVERR
nr:MAG TPA: hypothetical protein [Caudoviricetes sp.]